jgi:hypothetical protein
MEWDWLVAEYICRTCHSFRCCKNNIAKKNEVKIEKKVRQQHSTHQAVLLRATISFNNKT